MWHLQRFKGIIEVIVKQLYFEWKAEKKYPFKKKKKKICENNEMKTHLFFSLAIDNEQ